MPALFRARRWTFLLDLGLWLWAGILYNRTRRL